MNARFVRVSILFVICFFIFSACKSEAEIPESLALIDTEKSISESEVGAHPSNINEVSTYDLTQETIAKNTDTEPTTMESTDVVKEMEPSKPMTTEATNSVSDTEPSKPTLIWTYIDVVPINDKARELIAQVLEEKGIECNIEYVKTSIVDVDSYPLWVKKQRENGHSPDILHTSFWHHGEYDFADFARDELLPLNGYLKLKKEKHSGMLIRKRNGNGLLLVKRSTRHLFDPERENSIALSTINI